ncbi:hypothetical protein BN136_2118 [Cronobacter universalis NCTC 9529]|nr:hypothetical protein BN136_2118 [Cronobacter universalis NCTC 9529]
MTFCLIFLLAQCGFYNYVWKISCASQRDLTEKWRKKCHTIVVVKYA